MKPSHHPDECLLVDTAVGTLGPAVDLVIRTHMAMCDRCATDGDHLDHLGGEILDSLAGVPMAADSLASVLGRLETPESPSSTAVAASSDLPQPLMELLPNGFDDPGPSAA